MTVPTAIVAVHGLYSYWRERPVDPRPTEELLVRRVKIGRNEPCPCGSGKKYKRCCAAVDMTVH